MIADNVMYVKPAILSLNVKTSHGGHEGTEHTEKLKIYIFLRVLRIPRVLREMKLRITVLA